MQAEPFVKYHLRWGGIISASSSATMIFVALTNSYYVLIQDKIFDEYPSNHVQARENSVSVIFQKQVKTLESPGDRHIIGISGLVLKSGCKHSNSVNHIQLFLLGYSAVADVDQEYHFFVAC